MISVPFLVLSMALFCVLTFVAIGYFVARSRRVIALNKQGLHYIDWEMWDDAVRCFQKAVALDPSHALTHYNLGFVLYFGKRLANAAMGEFEKAITKDAACAPACYALGHALFHAAHETKQAMDYLKKAVQIDPKLAQAYNTMGLIEIQHENWKAAADHFRSAITKNPRCESAYCNLSIALVYQGKNIEALEYAQKYVELNPHAVLARNNIGNIYGSCGMRKKAIQELTISRALCPDDWNVHFWLGCLYLQTGEYTRAIVSFTGAIRLRGDFALANYNLALCFEQCGKHGLAKKHIDHAIELDPALGKNLIEEDDGGSIAHTEGC